MASIFQDKRTGKYILRIRFGGREHKRSLKTMSEKTAIAAKVMAEETLRHVETGITMIPPGTDPIDFLVNGGRCVLKLTTTTLGELFDRYFAELPSGAKSASTLNGERIHRRHLESKLGKKTIVESINGDRLQKYIQSRGADRWRNRPVGPQTIRKELVTLRMVWRWGQRNVLVQADFPGAGLEWPKTESPEPFRTFDEVKVLASKILEQERQADELNRLWSSVFLPVDQVVEVIEVMCNFQRAPWLGPMAAFVGWTGCRRSEALRSERRDWDFDQQVVLVREKKRKHHLGSSFRSVPIHPSLAPVVQNWFEKTEGRFTIGADNTPITINQAHHTMKAALKKTRWEQLKGWHVFRHSMPSNLARAGLGQSIINAWLGHQTEEMAARYRHLFPSEMAQIQRLGVDNLPFTGGQ